MGSAHLGSAGYKPLREEFVSASMHIRSLCLVFLIPEQTCTNLMVGMDRWVLRDGDHYVTRDGVGKERYAYKYSMQALSKQLEREGTFLFQDIYIRSCFLYVVFYFKHIVCLYIQPCLYSCHLYVLYLYKFISQHILVTLTRVMVKL